MRKLAILIAITVLLVTVVPVVANSGGFDEFGYNYGACLFNGWDGYCDRNIEGGPYPGTNDSVLVMKWSKNWIPMADEPVGAWCTNHFTWYSNDYEEATWYGYDTRLPWTDMNTAPQAKYKIVEFLKLMKVGDDATAWDKYQAGGAYDAGWGNYASSVPMYVVFQDTLKVYERSWNLDGDWVLAFNSTKWPGGNPYNHDMVVLGGIATGGCPAGGPYVNSWTANVSVSGDSVTIDGTYLPGSGVYPYVFMATGTIAPNGTIGDGWKDSLGDSGDWSSTSGPAIASYNNVIAEFNLATTSPKGLGQPIF